MSKESTRDFLRAAWIGRTDESSGITVPMKIPWSELSMLGNLSILTLYYASKNTLALLKHNTQSENAKIIAGIT